MRPPFQPPAQCSTFQSEIRMALDSDVLGIEPIACINPTPLPETLKRKEKKGAIRVMQLGHTSRCHTAAT